MTEPTAGFAQDASQEARQIFLKRKRAYWQTPWPAGKTDAWICAALAAVTLLLACRRIWAGGFGWSDAPLHAMDGAFLLDAVRAWPRNDPVGWAENYYAHFPCLGFVVYWPPGFAVLEAMAFAVFGLHALVARATVALCAATAVALAYLVGRRISGRAGGVCFALLLATCPFGMQWARQVMLEWPAVMWILLAVYAAVRFADEPTLPMGVVAGLAVLAAYMTKQQAGHIALVTLAVPIVRADRWSAVPWWKMVIPVLLRLPLDLLRIRRPPSAPPSVAPLVGLARLMALADIGHHGSDIACALDRDPHGHDAVNADRGQKHALPKDHPKSHIFTLINGGLGRLLVALLVR